MNVPNLYRLNSKIIAVFVWLAGFSFNARALNVPGYIVTKQADTVYGFVQLSRFNQVTGAFILNGYDANRLYYEVAFRSGSEKSYKIYIPDQLLGYGFRFESQTYVFRTFAFAYRGLFKKKRYRYKFLFRLYHGSINLYQGQVYMMNPVQTVPNDPYLIYPEYYLYRNGAGLLKAVLDRKDNTMRNLFRKLGADEKFIRTIPDHARIFDLERILVRYDAWLSAHTVKTIKF